jgi:GNAT superfamily N-acetyltransferase
VREWDPRTAPDEEIEAVVRALNAALDADLPDDPRWRATGVREYLCETVPGERRFCWVADSNHSGWQTGPVGIIGHANVLLLNDIGVVEVLVHPSVRHRGIGRALVSAAARRAYDEGMASLGVEVAGGTPAMKFWEALGFQRGYTELRSVLSLASVDWRWLGEITTALQPGYRLEYHPGSLPGELLDPYAAAKAVRLARGTPDLELRPSSYDAQRLAASLDTLHRRGMPPHLVLAVHEGSGDVAALTEVVVPAQHPTRADQYDTIVVPDHQGLGLERAIKARMLLELRGSEPQLTEVQTWNALENDPIAGVNAELGFRPDREWCEYEVDVAGLLAMLHRDPAAS